jgi:Ca2+-binding RTX toxin-like protein
VITYTLAGGADAAKFNINASTGALSFINAPNFESPTDVAPLNSYNVNVQVSDGALTDTQALTVNVTNIDEAATGSIRISSYARPTATSVNITAVNTIVDPDTMSNVVSYQWQAGTASSGLDQFGLVNYTFTDILGANSATLNTQITDGSRVVRVVSSYTDAFGSHTFVSGETAFIQFSNPSYPTATTFFRPTTGTNIFIDQDNVSSSIFASPGNDTIDGGAGLGGIGIGNDYRLVFFSADAVINLTTGVSSSADTGVDKLIGIQNVYGGQGNDLIIGDQFANTLIGLGGNDTIQGGAGDDLIYIEFANGFGSDVLTGGLGNDTYYCSYSSLSGSGTTATITDFKVSGTDLINLNLIDADTALTGNQSFIFNSVATTAFSAAGQLIYHYEGAGANEITVLQGNLNATLTADFEIVLTGHIVFNAATDFVL